MPMFMIFVYKWKAKYLMRPIFDLLLIDNVWFDGSFTSAALSKKKSLFCNKNFLKLHRGNIWCNNSSKVASSVKEQSSPIFLRHGSYQYVHVIHELKGILQGTCDNSCL